jgi:hypothetical protein
MTDPLWRGKVAVMRKEAMRTIREIRSGEVSEEDVDKLNNFVQFALALMLIHGEKSWARAKVNAEIMSYTIKEETK